MSNYPEGSMRGSGIYSSDREVTLDSPCECGSVDAVEFTDDWGFVTVTCSDCETSIERLADYDEDGPDWSREYEWDREDAERDAWLDDRELV